DGDGISDGDEVNGTFVGCAHGTNPLKADTDGDGLSDGQEIHGIVLNQKVRRVVNGKIVKRKIGRVFTSPCEVDTDHDGLSDSAEVHGFTLKTRVLRVHLGGKHRWFSTYRIGHVVTNPTVKDTDGDHLSDKQEVRGLRYRGKHKTRVNPDNYDTDFGGIGDGAEVRAHANPVNAHSTPKHPKRARIYVNGFPVG
ncbi:MAG TPA: binary toxin-like calcium binding domain-containing protein, partial [Marmoricola sp.]